MALSLPCTATVLTLLVSLAHPASCIRYQTGATREAEGSRLQVHLVPHSHDDAGWLKTVDQYYWGSRQDIQPAGIQYVLDSIVQSLIDNPDRRFNFAEMSFLSRWWAQQDDDMRAQVQTLVREGRLAFQNGGYVQHDEASAHYVAMIDQTTRGHQFLLKNFDYAPRVGWQIDPFGHTATQAGLMGASVGFDAVFFGRADYQDMGKRQAAKQLEMVWRGTGGGPSCRADGDTSADLFTGNFASGNYGPPAGFWWEWGSSPDPPIADDPRLDEYNVDQRIEDFVQRVMELANVTQGRDIMLTMGSDFCYANAHVWYKNMDKLVHYANKDGRLNVFYSTPADYVAAKHSYDTKWPLKADDFFPYADTPHSYWTGYFTSRPTSKGFIKQATSYLQAARQLEAFVGLSGPNGPSTDALEEAVSMCQHHDSITGTAKQHVANDYNKRIHKGMAEAQAVVANALTHLIYGGRPAAETKQAGEEGSGGARQLHAKPQEQLALAAAALTSEGAPLLGAHKLHACNWLNVSSCEPTVELSQTGRGMFAVAYNPLAWSREAPVRVPVSTKTTCTWEVTGPEGQRVSAEVVPISKSTACLQNLLASVNATDAGADADAEIVFMAELPPLGYAMFEIKPAKEQKCTPPVKPTPATAKLHGGHASTAHRSGSLTKKSGASSITNGLVTVDFDTSTGLMSSIALENGPSAKVATTLMWYNASDGQDVDEDRGQSSGAYIFRPNGVYPVQQQSHLLSWLGRGKGRANAVELEVYEGDGVSEAHQVFSDWATLVTRVYKGQKHVEVEWTVGPIPFEDSLGREVVVRYATDLNSIETFYTDANGRAMVPRRRNYRPSWDLNVTEDVAGNYYPVTAAAFIEDEHTQFAVITDRAQGAASLADGELELMVHRRTLVDDRRGVNEALNETMCGCSQCNCPGLVARGVHWLMLSPSDSAGRTRRTLQQHLTDPPLLMFSPATGAFEGSGGSLRRSFSLTGGRVLHAGTHLLTVMRLSAERLLVRLAHLMDVGEDPSLGAPMTEDLGRLLGPFGCSGRFVEMSLTGNQRRSDAEKRRLVFTAGEALGGKDTVSGCKASQVATGDSCGDDCTENGGAGLVRLQPMEIRTFEVAC